MITRDVEDIERQIHRKRENKKYNIILVNRSRKNELRRTKHNIEDNKLRVIKKMIKDKELVT